MTERTPDLRAIRIVEMGKVQFACRPCAAKKHFTTGYRVWPLYAGLDDLAQHVLEQHPELLPVESQPSGDAR
jgi:hypothetical protein